jgi:hypothetical protein
MAIGMDCSLSDPTWEACIHVSESTLLENRARHCYWKSPSVPSEGQPMSMNIQDWWYSSTHWYRKGFYILRSRFSGTQSCMFGLLAQKYGHEWPPKITLGFNRMTLNCRITLVWWFLTTMAIGKDCVSSDPS